jgi:hypothetical protein
MRAMLKNKKAKMEISVLLLVLTTFILVIFSLFMFNIRSDSLRKEITTSSSIDEIYSSSKIFEFNIRHIAEQVIQESKIGSEVDFINKFKSKFFNQFLLNEKSYTPYEYGLYTKFNGMMTDSKNYEVRIKDNSLSFNMKEFTFSERMADNDAGIVSMSYVKNITFQIQLQ